MPMHTLTYKNDAQSLLSACKKYTGVRQRRLLKLLDYLAPID